MDPQHKEHPVGNYTPVDTSSAASSSNKKRGGGLLLWLSLLIVMVLGIGVGLYLVGQNQNVVPRAAWEKLEDHLYVNCDPNRCVNHSGVRYDDAGHGGFFGSGSKDKWLCQYNADDWRTDAPGSPGPAFRFQAAVVHWGCNNGMTCTDEGSVAEGLDKASCERVKRIAHVVDRTSGPLKFNIRYCGSQQLDIAGTNAFNEVVDTRQSVCNESPQVSVKLTGPQSICVGQPVTLKWTPRNAGSCRSCMSLGGGSDFWVNGPNSTCEKDDSNSKVRDASDGTHQTTGNENNARTYHYKIVCRNGSVSASDVVAVEVKPAASCSQSTPTPTPPNCPVPSPVTNVSISCPECNQ